MTRAYLPAAAATAAAVAGVLALLGREAVALAMLGLAGVIAAIVLGQVQRRAQRHAERVHTDLAEHTRRAHAELATLSAEIRVRLAELSSAQERTSRRLAATVVRERRRDRMAGAWHQREVLRAVEEVSRAVEEARKPTVAALRTLERRLNKQQSGQTRELEALMQLFRQVEPRAPMPSSGQWALDPTGLLELWHQLTVRRPERVLELGSGASSVWIGYALERHQGRLVSVDHDDQFAEQTRAQLHRHGLAEVAEVRLAPLQPVALADGTYRWYDRAVFTDLSDVDMLVVDGPPGNTGPRARYPALPVLVERFSPDAVVLLDDTSRADEQEIVASWLATVPGLACEPATIGNCAVLRYQRPASG